MNYSQWACYGFAINQDDEIVSINKAIQLRLQGLSNSYYCPNRDCNGELTTVMSKTKINHFRHKKSHCSLESVEHHLAKTIIEKAINRQHTISLFFKCTICNKHNFVWSLPSKVNRAQKEYLYPNTLYRGDVAAFEADNIEPTVMFEVYHSHRVDSIKQAGISRWLEVTAYQVIQGYKNNATHHQWDVISSSPSHKPLLCTECKLTFETINSQEKRLKNLPRHFKKIPNMYNLYCLLFNESAISMMVEDMTYWAKQLSNTSINDLALDDEQLKTRNNQLINTLYKMLRSSVSNYFLNPSDQAYFILSVLVENINPKAKALLWKNVFAGNLTAGQWQLKLVRLFNTVASYSKNDAVSTLTNQMAYNQEVKLINNSLEKIALAKSQGLDRNQLVAAILQAFNGDYLLRFFLENPEYFSIDLLSATHNYGFNQPHFRSKSYYIKLIAIAPKIKDSNLTLNWLNNRVNPSS